jgi:hypothetical protein
VGGGVADDVAVGVADGLGETDGLGDGDGLGEEEALGDADALGEDDGVGHPEGPGAVHVLYVLLANAVMKMDWTWETDPLAPAPL